MVKKIISVATAFLMLCCMIPFAAFAETAVCPKCGESTLTTNQDISVFVGEQIGLPLSLKRAYCSNCHYAKYEYNILGIAGEQAYDDGDELHIINFLKKLKSELLGQNATATKAPSGIGRKDLPGYASDDGTPSVSSDGGIIWQPTWDDVFQKAIEFDTGDMVFWIYGFFTSDISHYYTDFDLTYKKGVSDAIITLSPSSKADFKWDIPISKLSFDSFDFTVPIKGKYFRLESPALYNSALDEMVYYSSSNPSSFCDSGVSLSVYVSKSSANRIYVRNCYWHIWLPKYKIIPYNSADKPTSQTNITINNNTWNGNIYTDNSTNLTYIYPQYTTINENNETVTNISNNPIIYNNETKQYYTYDSVTNNYYYITYEQQPATPTPSPSPSPSPAPTETPSPSESPAPTPTPDPGENPTPTPTPGGGTTVTPGGDNPGSTSTPESGNKGDSGSSGWNPFKWLTDLLKDLVESILKGIWKLITSIFGFILWLLSLLFKLFPWMPNSGILALCAGVVVVTVIRIIKFITGR